MQQKFDIIRQSIVSKKNECNPNANEEIMQECHTLKIKNIARKYSEYKLKENLDAMQKKIKMQKQHRCLTQGWTSHDKKIRPKSCAAKKAQLLEQDEEFFREVQEAVKRCQERISTDSDA